MENIDTESLIEDLMYWNHSDDKDRKDLQRIEKEFGIEKILVDVEKHNELQYTYYFEIDYGLKENYFIEIENGIMNGTRVNNSDWGVDSKPESKIVNVLKDVIFNNKEFEKWCNWKGISEDRKSQTRLIAKSLFESHKQELMDANRNQSYDNYVTGGGTLKTNQYYRDKFNSLSEKGVFWEFVYEEMEVDINIV